ncbi:cryptochrome/photolyase family protein [Halospeciosus flavus]|uniref:Cryptochrome/photolyase family protein n=1 Tax=Halospeciosus flavus TaxID=3032283 RepID=A0ABD5Z1Z1_9EURY|nr:deoxyribodipyrimidine photo-lyase [Halospeciosus flavus]
MHLFWHRSDLRVADNLGLADAADAVDDEEAVVPLFVLDDGILEHGSPVRVAFLLDCLADLRAAYRERGSDLLVRRGDASAVVPAVAAECDADRVVWNHDYSGLARERDEAVRAALDEQGTRHEQFHDAVLHEPGAIRTNAGDPYSVFSYFWKKWRDREKRDPVAAPDGDALADLDGDDLPALDTLGFDEPDANPVEAGQASAHRRLEAFCEEDIYRYDEAREYPAEAATSRLSQDLSFGSIGVRTVFERTVQAMVDADDEPAREAVEEYQRQLAFREFYVQVLYFHPETVTENYDAYPKPIEWREDDAELQAWKEGRTGVPIVDAGMRQLREEGFVHNRVRMLVASFLTKDLLQDWRAGYAHFREHLVDHDTANDVGGWQWAASTGTDAQPYFRIFNPWSQQPEYDPDAEYVKAYVDELADVPTEKIHAWNELDADERDSLAPDYPDPIVDHGERREAALAMFERARGEDD